MCNIYKEIDMSDYINFQKCLKFGQIFEKKAQAKLIEYYKNKYHIVNENNTYEYDFILSNGKYYEVKYCSLNNCNDTIFLETVAFDKPSGINKTKADYYIFVIKQKNVNMFINTELLEFIKINVKKLIKIIKKELFSKYFKDEKKEGYLIDVNIIKQYGKIV
jgi:hypothetical protein